MPLTTTASPTFLLSVANVVTTDTLSIKLKDLDRRYRRLKGEYTVFREQAESLEEEYQELQRENEKLKGENEEVKERLRIKDEEDKEAQKDLDNVEKLVKENNRGLYDLDEIVYNLKEQIGEDEEERRRLGRRVEVLEEELVAKTTECDDNAGEIEKLKESIMRCNEVIMDFRGEVRRLQEASGKKEDYEGGRRLVFQE